MNTHKFAIGFFSVVLLFSSCNTEQTSESHAVSEELNKQAIDLSTIEVLKTVYITERKGTHYMQ